MLKFFLWILLAANVAVFAFQRGYLGLSDGHEPARISNQLNADKIILMSSTAATAVVASADGAADAGKSPDKKPELIACTEVGNFAQAEAQRFEKQLTSLALGERLQRREVKEVASHMVYIPPQADKEGADKKAAQLRGLGVTNFFIMQENSNLKWGISLGVFKTEEAAQNHLDALIRQGVHSAKIGARNITTTRLAFQLRDLDAETKTGLDKIKAEFPNQEIRKCESDQAAG